MVVKTMTLRGDRARAGLNTDGRIVPFDPKWGMTRHSTSLLAAVQGQVEDNARIFVTADETPVLVPADAPADRELVLVKEYHPGCGAKRWPSFAVEFGDHAQVLSQASTQQGSGGETWTLVVAPLGWAQNIATRFVRKRDTPGQTLAYKPGFDPDEQGDLAHFDEGFHESPFAGLGGDT